MFLRAAILLGLTASLGACSSDSGNAIVLPAAIPVAIAGFGTGTTAPNANSLPYDTGGVENGLLIGSTLPATIFSAQNARGTVYNATPTSTTITDATAVTGVGFSVAGDAAATPRVAGAPDLISASTSGTLFSGNSIPDLVGGEGAVTFNGAAFGAANASSLSADIDSISVFPLAGAAAPIILENAAAIRYVAGAPGDSEAFFGVGFVGAPTTNMPSPTAGVVGYTAAHRGLLGRAELAGGIAPITLNGTAVLEADFGNATIEARINDLTITTPRLVGGVATNVDITGDQASLLLTGDIERNAFSGAGAFITAGEQITGLYSRTEVVGGFFGDNASEAIAAYDIQGITTLEGADAGFAIQGVIVGER